MGCIINWDAKNTPDLSKIKIADGGCIVNWTKDGKEAESLSKLGGCIINWDANTQLKSSSAAAGCIIDWDAKTDIAALTKGEKEFGCLINWMGVDKAQLEKAAVDGCIINW